MFSSPYVFDITVPLFCLNFLLRICQIEGHCKVYMVKMLSMALVLLVFMTEPKKAAEFKFSCNYFCMLKFFITAQSWTVVSALQKLLEPSKIISSATASNLTILSLSVVWIILSCDWLSFFFCFSNVTHPLLDMLYLYYFIFIKNIYRRIHSTFINVFFYFCENNKF